MYLSKHIVHVSSVCNVHCSSKHFMELHVIYHYLRVKLCCISDKSAVGHLSITCYARWEVTELN